MSKSFSLDWSFGFGNGRKVMPILDGMQAWYDTGDSRYMTLSSTAITQLLDRSGKGNNTDVQVGAARPTWTANQYGSLSAAVFDGVANYLVLPAALYSIPNGNNTLFVVSKSASDSTQQRTITMAKAGSGRFLHEYSGTAGTSVFSSRNTNTGGVSISGVTKANANIFACYRSGTTLSISVNGGAEVTNTNGVDEPGVDAAYIGTNSNASGTFLNGSFLNMILYNRTLSSAEIMYMNRYLSFVSGAILA